MALVSVLLSSGAAQAVTDYEGCLEMIEQDPQAAELKAGEWARFGGGPAARHCYALALLAIGAPNAAIDELIGIATEEPGLEPQARADLLVQAGELLIDTGDMLTAAIVSEQALRLSPRDPAALGLRGAVRIANGDAAAGIRDLDQAMERGGADPKWLVRRAQGHRARGDLIAARDDAGFASELAPDDATAWLELGRVQARLGDKNNARQSLLRSFNLDREGAIGRAAQLAMQRMEAGID